MDGRGQKQRLEFRDSSEVCCDICIVIREWSPRWHVYLQPRDALPPQCNNNDPFWSQIRLLLTRPSSLSLSFPLSHPLTRLQLSPRYDLTGSNLRHVLSSSGCTKTLETFSHSWSTPRRSRPFLSVFFNTLPRMHCEGGFVRGHCPSPNCDWQVRAAVHASDGFTWGVCAQRGRQRGTYTGVCFSQLHCWSSPWVPLSVSSLGRHPSSDAVSLCAERRRLRDAKRWELHQARSHPAGAPDNLVEVCVSTKLEEVIKGVIYSGTCYC